MKQNKRKRLYLWMIIYLTMMVWCVSGCALLGQEDTVMLDSQTTQSNQSSETDSSQTMVYCDETTQYDGAVDNRASKEGEMYVYVCGAVKKPGVYTLHAGMRICDAVEAAGGLSKKADAEAMNLAEPVADGQKIYIPGKNEKTEQTSQQLETSQAGLPETTDDGTTKVNLNQATKEQLMTLPGIGESKAQSIINYRQEKGNFTSVDEIMNIEGIKDGVFSKIKDYITVG